MRELYARDAQTLARFMAGLTGCEKDCYAVMNLERATELYSHLARLPKVRTNMLACRVKDTLGEFFVYLNKDGEVSFGSVFDGGNAMEMICDHFIIDQTAGSKALKNAHYINGYELHYAKDDMASGAFDESAFKRLDEALKDGDAE